MRFDATEFLSHFGDEIKFKFYAFLRGYDPRTLGLIVGIPLFFALLAVSLSKPTYSQITEDLQREEKVIGK